MTINAKKMADDQLIKAFADGDNKAFDTLLARYQQKVHNYILQIVKDSSMADDVFQETFIKAIMTIKQGRYSHDGKFGAWITRIAHNIIIDSFRQEKSQATISADNSETDVLNRKELSDSNIEDLLVEAGIRNDVRMLVKNLPAEQRQVVLMRYYSGMSFKEIAARTNVSINTALGRMRYAMQNLRRMTRENRMVLSR